jgi:CheY-like chemotaxis protein
MLMPEVDGIQVLETLQSQGIRLRIIVLTADVQEWLKARCLELGATTFLNKPVKQEQLRKALQEILGTPQPLEAKCS